MQYHMKWSSHRLEAHKLHAWFHYALRSDVPRKFKGKLEQFTTTKGFDSPNHRVPRYRKNITGHTHVVCCPQYLLLDDWTVMEKLILARCARGMIWMAALHVSVPQRYQEVLSVHTLQKESLSFGLRDKKATVFAVHPYYTSLLLWWKSSSCIYLPQKKKPAPSPVTNSRTINVHFTNFLYSHLQDY